MYTLIIGLDAFDPQMFEQLYERGALPHLAKYVDRGGYSRFTVVNPPQSEVSWTSIATGADPGVHGMFDFVHRDPKTYSRYVSLLPTKKDLFGVKFTPPVNAQTLFDQAAADGYPAASMWWPATFPARLDSAVRTLPGLGTPDIQGRLGVGCLYSLDRTQESGLKTALEPLKPAGQDNYKGTLYGPGRKEQRNGSRLSLDFRLELQGAGHARLVTGRQSWELVEGEWSPVVELSFKAGTFYKLHALTRVLLTQTQPTPRLYFLPLQIHPLHPIWPYAASPAFARETWNAAGPFLTLGWPQDTTGLEEDMISGAQFNELCKLISAARLKALEHHLLNFREGVFGVVFDSLDRVQHMFWREQPEFVEAWYRRLDDQVGRIEALLKVRAGDNLRMLIVSDHGFSRFDYKVHLNRWLEQNGYLVRRTGSQERELEQVDWSQTQAYAIGLNSLYLNLQGREGQGIVSPEEQDSLREKLSRELSDWKGPDGRPVLRRVTQAGEAFHGPLSGYGPDLLAGYTPGYRASAQTGLGAWEAEPIEVNQDHWEADHCIDPEKVPGVIFANQDLSNFPNPSYREIPALAIGKNVDSKNLPPPQGGHGGEDQKLIEERLKSLGYL